MKKIIFIIMLSLLLTGCNKSSLPQKPNMESKNIQNNDIKKISDYFPYQKNTLISYIGGGDEYAKEKIYFEYINKNKAQIKINNLGTSLVSVVEYKDGELRENYSQEEFYSIQNLLEANSENYNVLLKEPLKVGMSWTLSDGTKRTITGADVIVATPNGEYKALEVTTQLSDNKKQCDYYVVGVGRVATIYKDNNFEVKTLLEKIEKNKSILYKIRFYYPYLNNSKIGYIVKEVEFKTNDKIEKIFEDGFKNLPSNKVISPISKNTKINSIKLDEKNNMVRIDFSKEFIQDMNVGSSQEEQILDSIVNTLGSYYGLDKVYISVEGNPYSSGHIAINKKEYFTVDDKNIKEIK